MYKVIVGVYPRPCGRLTGFLTVLVAGASSVEQALERAWNSINRGERPDVVECCRALIEAGDYAIEGGV